jgi:EF hand
MRKTLVIASLLALTGGAIAQDMTFTGLDADTSGEISYEELSVAKPDLTVEQFAEADADSSGALSEAEFTAYMETMAE